jgi:hypothetical protein
MEDVAVPVDIDSVVTAVPLKLMSMEPAPPVPVMSIISSARALSVDKTLTQAKNMIMKLNRGGLKGLSSQFPATSESSS